MTKKVGIKSIDPNKKQQGLILTVPDLAKGEVSLKSELLIPAMPRDAADVQTALMLIGIHHLLGESVEFQQQMFLAGVRARGGDEAVDEAIKHIPEISGKGEDFKPVSSSDALSMIMSAGTKPDPDKLN